MWRDDFSQKGERVESHVVRVAGEMRESQGNERRLECCVARSYLVPQFVWTDFVTQKSSLASE